MAEFLKIKSFILWNQGIRTHNLLRILGCALCTLHQIQKYIIEICTYSIIDINLFNLADLLVYNGHLIAFHSGLGPMHLEAAREEE